MHIKKKVNIKYLNENSGEKYAFLLWKINVMQKPGNYNFLFIFFKNHPCVCLPGVLVTLKDSVEKTAFSPRRETYTLTPR